mmetsp:Transcript_4437/g.13440  ORF Transcript_4437/g.13440 Transcript_4437/m.13440 type:complete len:113 (+) Transcript_4437:2-340(+)
MELDVASGQTPELEHCGPSSLCWEEKSHGGLIARLPLPSEAKGKHCRVEFKRNWLRIFAPQPTDTAALPSRPLLDFQLYGAVDPDLCDWSVQRSEGEVYLLLELQKSPVYSW